jgi:hypothetical protein
MRIERCLVLLVSVFLLCQLSAHAQPNVNGLRPMVSSLNQAVYATHAGDGSNHMFIVEQRGKIQVLQPGATSPYRILNVSSLVSTSGGERGLLGLAFHRVLLGKFLRIDVNTPLGQERAYAAKGGLHVDQFIYR